jgi:hypothetical protein
VQRAAKAVSGALCATRLPDGNDGRAYAKQRHASLYRCHILLEGRRLRAPGEVIRQVIRRAPGEATACITLIIVGMHQHSIVSPHLAGGEGMQA